MRNLRVSEQRAAESRDALPQAQHSSPIKSWIHATGAWWKKAKKACAAGQPSVKFLLCLSVTSCLPVHRRKLKFSMLTSGNSVRPHHQQLSPSCPLLLKSSSVTKPGFQSCVNFGRSFAFHSLPASCGSPDNLTFRMT